MCNDYVESQDSHSAGRDAIWKNQFVASRHSVAPSLDHLAFINGLLAGHLHEWSGAWAFWIVKDAYMICFTPRLKMWKSWHKMMISFHASTQYFYQGGESQRMDTFQQSLGVPVSPPQICLPNWAELLGSEVGDLPNVWYKSPSRIWDQTVYLVFRLVEFGSKRKEWKRGENPGVSPVKLHVVNHLLHALKKPWIALLKNPGVWAYRRQQWLCLLMEKFRVPFPLLLPKPVFIIVDQFEELLKKPGQQFGLCARKNYGSRCFRNWRLGLEDWWEITTVYRELRSCGFFTTGTSTCQAEKIYVRLLSFTKEASRSSNGLGRCYLPPTWPQQLCKNPVCCYSAVWKTSNAQSLVTPFGISLSLIHGIQVNSDYGTQSLLNLATHGLQFERTLSCRMGSWCDCFASFCGDEKIAATQTLLIPSL